MQLRQSMRRAAKMRLALAGASGSGKTYSSLLIAYGMTGDWSKIAVIDSENCSADLYARKGAERFKIFIGFKNLVCCNMCVSTDGLIDDLRVMSVQQIYDAAVQLFCRYEMTKHLNAMARLSDYTLTEHQFAQLIGKTRLYQFLPSNERRALPAMEFTDSHINAIARAYYADENFACNDDRSIDLWRVYNLFTGANRSSYIDTFLSRSLNATTFTHGLTRALDGDEQYRWFVE